MNNSSALVTTKEVDQYKEVRDRLYGIVSELKGRTTPPQFVKTMMDGDGKPRLTSDGSPMQYPAFEYMVEEMDKFHPLRSEVVTFVEKANVVVATAVITDLRTGEIRTGVDAHRITFQRGKEKNLDAVVDLGNDYKSAEQEALRNCYSRFGVCSDIYKKQLPKPPTQAQQERFDTLIIGTRDMTFSDHSKDNLFKDWIQGTVAKWENQSEKSADKFIDTFEAQLNSVKEKQNGGK